MRRLAVELRPSALDDFGLEPALRRLGQTVREGGALDVQVEARLGAQRLPADVETALYRIVQEALTNVVKHAGAAHVSIVLTRKPASVLVMIEDDGRGFDPAETTAAGLGLLGMRERVELLDGTFQVDAAPRRRDDADRRAAAASDAQRHPHGRAPAAQVGRVARERRDRPPERRCELEAVTRAGGGDDDPTVPFEHERLVGRVRVEARLRRDRLGIELREASRRPGRHPAHDRRVRRAGLVRVGRRPGMVEPRLEPDAGAASA